MSRGSHGYGGHHFVDWVSWHGTKPVLGSLGVLILSAILHDGWDDVRLELGNRHSEVREIRIERARLRFDSVYHSLRVKADELSYRPQERDCHPFWRHLRLPPSELPTLRLSNAANMAVTEADRAARDVLWGFGHLGGATHFATLLLDLSRPSSLLDEVQLEGEMGFRGVGPGSPEVAIWLPGSSGWNEAWTIA
jgi:hypothetical protein